MPLIINFKSLEVLKKLLISLYSKLIYHSDLDKILKYCPSFEKYCLPTLKIIRSTVSFKFQPTYRELACVHVSR